MNKNHEYLNLELKAESLAEGNGRTIIGYASVFDYKDFGGDITRKGCFVKSLSERKPVFAYSHDMDDIIGWFDTLEEDEHGLKFTAQFVDSERGNHMKELVKNGAITGISIGYVTRDYKDNPDGSRDLLELAVYEISLVAHPMNDISRINSIKSEAGSYDKRAIEKKLREVGFSRSEALKFLAKGFDGLQNLDQSDSDASKASQSDSDENKSSEELILSLKNLLSKY